MTKIRQLSELIILASSLLSGFMLSCNIDPVNGDEVTGVYLNKETTVILVGKSETLTATVIPANAEDKTVAWSTSNPAIASVNQEGLVTGIAPGTATVKVTAADAANGTKTATCEVTVSAETVSITGITLNKASTSILVNESEVLTATISPTNATNQVATWTSSNPAIATVSPIGIVTGIAAGTTTVRVTAADTANGTKTASCEVTVATAPVSVTGISLNKASVNLPIGSEETLTATIAPSNATNQNILWNSTNKNVATVTQGGLLKGVAVGTATVTVTTADGEKKASCEVTVTPIAVTGVTLNKTVTGILVGATESLTASISPDDATDQGITWKSSDTSIATVSDQGLVTGIKAGSATITVTAADASNGTQTATCEVTVSAVTISVTSVTLDTTTASIPVGDSVNLTATIAPLNATNQAVTWKSSSDAIATVTASGSVSAIAPGTATITVTTADDAKTATCEVTVTPIAVTGVTLDKTRIGIQKGAPVTLSATVAPLNATNQSVTWSSSADGIATVTQAGLVEGVADGEATIKVTTADGTYTATCKVIVGPLLTLVYTGPTPSWALAYAAWIEDEDEKNIQNVYVCNKIAAHSITGDALPNWYTVKRPQFSADIDAVTGASTQGSKTVQLTLALGSVRKFTVCFEIDHSKNNNAYFTDRPSFTYKSAIIDLDNLESSYDLTLNGWMSNDTTGTFSQTPTTTIPGWSTYLYMTDMAYVAEIDTTAVTGSNMVTSLNAKISAP